MYLIKLHKHTLAFIKISVKLLKCRIEGNEIKEGHFYLLMFYHVWTLDYIISYLENQTVVGESKQWNTIRRNYNNIDWHTITGVNWSLFTLAFNTKPAYYLSFSPQIL